MGTRLFFRIIQGFVAATVMILMLSISSDAQVKFKTLHTFSGTDGRQLEAGVILDPVGNVYGTAYGGGVADGVVFELSPKPRGGWKESALYNFQWGSDGVLPEGGLVLDKAGNLYGTTNQGGATGCGTVFKLTPNGNGSWTKSILYGFRCGSDAGNPTTSLIFDSAGSLYGTTAGGGSSGNGAVFKLTPNQDGSWTESVLYSFAGGADGSAPWSSLVLDGTGSLYGTTTSGGSFASGAVYKLAPNESGGWTESLLYSFTGGTDGGTPYTSLIFDSIGSLYGTTVVGGHYGYGAIFKLTTNPDGSWTERVLHSFNYKDGGFPYAGLIFDAAGNLYGTTLAGGVYQYGAVFELKRKLVGGWNYRVLHSFRDDASGCNPSSTLSLDGAGNLYGTTYGNGNTTFGSVFEITP